VVAPLYCVRRMLARGAGMSQAYAFPMPHASTAVNSRANKSPCMTTTPAGKLPFASPYTERGIRSGTLSENTAAPIRVSPRQDAVQHICRHRRVDGRTLRSGASCAPARFLKCGRGFRPPESGTRFQRPAERAIYARSHHERLFLLGPFLRLPCGKGFSIPAV